jgi:hypothetical protein
MKRVMPLLALLGLALALCPLTLAWAQPQPQALGSAPLTKGQSGPAMEEEAVNEGLRVILTQALADLLGRKRLESALTLLAPPILANPQPLVMGYQITARHEAEDRLYLLVSAKVNLPALKAALEKLGLAQGLKVRLLPLVSLAVAGAPPFAWWQSFGQSQPISLAWAALSKRLDELGCQVILPEAAPPQSAGLEPSLEEAQALGRHFQAELVLVGQIEEVETPDGRKARAAVRILAVDSGKVVAGPVSLGQPEPTPPPAPQPPADQIQPAPDQPLPPPAPAPEQPQPAQGQPQPGPPPQAAPPQPPTLPAHNLGERLAQDLTDQLKLAGFGLTIQPVEVLVTVSGVKRFTDIQAVMETLRRMPQQVQEVKQQAIRAGQATFQVKLLSTTRQLADLLLAEDYPTFFINVIKVTAEELHLALVAK